MSAKLGDLQLAYRELWSLLAEASLHSPEANTFATRKQVTM